ncbi:hypothetical protein BH11PLA2_BH11PLA2_18670 [soil metagenome]
MTTSMSEASVIESLVERVTKLEKANRQLQRRLNRFERRSAELNYEITDEVLAECDRREKAMQEDPSRGLSLSEVKARIAAWSSKK